MCTEKHIKALSLFCGGGIGETYLKNVGIKTVVANELLEKRAHIYKFRFPEAEMIIGDIREKKEEIIQKATEAGVDLIIATPPCQGMSNLGKKDYVGDERNYLIFDVFDIIDQIKPKYIFIENVPKFLKMEYPFQGKIKLFPEILKAKYGAEYEIRAGIFNAADYNVPQMRNRTIIRMYKRGLVWDDPPTYPRITLREAIGDLPSIEAGEDSGIPYHVAPWHSKRHIEVMRHTPTGCSAHDNPIFYPKKESGERIKGFHNTYSRLSWDKVCPTRTMNSSSISGSNNVHPGREREDGTYSDARALSLLELLIVSSLPRNIQFPPGTPEKIIRDIIGEGIPPNMSKIFLKGIKKT